MTTLGLVDLRALAERNLIYTTTVTVLTYPEPTVVAQVARSDGDGWVPGAEHVEMKVSEYMAAFEAHNEAVREAAK